MHSSSPSAIFDVVNQVLHDRADEGEFCTACLVELTREGDGFRVVTSSAGHPLPVVLRADGTLDELGAYGTLLGAFEDTSRLDVGGRIARGDTVLMFTDGLEERRCAGAFFGDDAFHAVLRSSFGLTAQALVERLRDALRDFGTDPLDDDVAVLAMRVGGPDHQLLEPATPPRRARS